MRLTEKDADPKIKSIRVFFAISPNEFVQKQLAHQAEILEPTCGGRKIRTQNFHLTLLFLGEVSMHHIAILQKTMKNIPAKRFELILDKVCYWKRNQIVYIQANQFPNELFLLVDSLKTALSEAGFLFDKYTYRPHVTLIRKATRSVEINLHTPIKWHVNKWSLIQSKQTEHGVDYIPLKQWNLK
jgi:RNA 2',3'-cyclic 3'-phosphodiesterase